MTVPTGMVGAALLRSLRRLPAVDWRQDALIDAGAILDALGADEAVDADGDNAVYRVRTAQATHYCVDVFRDAGPETVFEAAVANDGEPGAPVAYNKANRGMWALHLAEWSARVRTAARRRIAAPPGHTLLPRIETAQADGDV
jgi:hypothetical protein